MLHFISLLILSPTKRPVVYVVPSLDAKVLRRKSLLHLETLQDLANIQIPNLKSSLQTIYIHFMNLLIYCL